MAKEISKTQIDRLGERLKKGKIEELDLQLLSQYRRSFAEASEEVVGLIRNELGLEPTVRPEKSRESIVDKLCRESTRLSQMQDIAGCRIVVADIASQDATVKSLNNLFEEVTLVDRRQQPSHGYRAVHLLVRRDEKLVEIQVRTQIQHLWAEFSEKLSDVLGSSLKYGGGDEKARHWLLSASDAVVSFETSERQYANLQAEIEEWLTKASADRQRKEAAQQLRERMALTLNRGRQEMVDGLRKAGEAAELAKQLAVELAKQLKG